MGIEWLHGELKWVKCTLEVATASRSDRLKFKMEHLSKYWRKRRSKTICKDKQTLVAEGKLPQDGLKKLSSLIKEDFELLKGADLQSEETYYRFVGLIGKSKFLVTLDLTLDKVEVTLEKVKVTLALRLTLERVRARVTLIFSRVTLTFSRSILSYYNLKCKFLVLTLNINYTLVPLP